MSDVLSCELFIRWPGKKWSRKCKLTLPEKKQKQITQLLQLDSHTLIEHIKTQLKMAENTAEIEMCYTLKVPSLWITSFVCHTFITQIKGTIIQSPYEFTKTEFYCIKKLPQKGCLEVHILLIYSLFCWIFVFNKIIYALSYNCVF